MANTTVGASVQVEFSSVGQMRKAIKDATVPYFFNIIKILDSINTISTGFSSLKSILNAGTNKQIIKIAKSLR